MPANFEDKLERDLSDISHKEILARTEVLEAVRRRASRGVQPPRSDVGTIILHWIFAITIITSLATGLRISADAREAVISKFLSPILPQGEIWTFHFFASLLLFFSATAYFVYLWRAGLRRRLSVRKTLVFTLPVTNKLRWGAVNIVLYWALYVLILVLTGTGIALYYGFGGFIVSVHAFCALTVLGYIFCHLISHFAYGGIQQLLRVFKPSRLIPNRATRKLPMAVAGILGLSVAAAVAALDVSTRDVLTVYEVGAPPKLDGIIEDEAWKNARPVFVRTMQGANLGGTGESLVEIRAVTHADMIYFAFRWEDPTRSLYRLHLIKREDGWHMIDKHAGDTDVTDFYEDKFAVLFGRHDGFGAGGAAHMGPHPADGAPDNLNRRGLHYTTDGSLMDMWQWKSSRGGMLGYMDDQYIGPLRQATPDETTQRARYQGGYWNNPGTAAYEYNFPFNGPQDNYREAILPKRLPIDYRKTALEMGSFDPTTPDFSAPEGVVSWLTKENSVPYTPQFDATIPVGTVIPGVIINGPFGGERGDLRCGAKWSDGHWTLEISRKLKTDSKFNLDFVKGEPLYMWVAVYDHTQTRHTRHMRSVKMEIR
jgi:cytochrome b subunit of formate dehydrogenase